MLVFEEVDLTRAQWMHDKIKMNYDELRVKYLSRKGMINQLFDLIPKAIEKKYFAIAVQILKQEIEEYFENNVSEKIQIDKKKWLLSEDEQKQLLRYYAIGDVSHPIIDKKVALYKEYLKMKVYHNEDNKKNTFYKN